MFEFAINIKYKNIYMKGSKNQCSETSKPYNHSLGILDKIISFLGCYHIDSIMYFVFITKNFSQKKKINLIDSVAFETHLKLLVVMSLLYTISRAIVIKIF